MRTKLKRIVLERQKYI